jgi:hypothetical protein
MGNKRKHARQKALVHAFKLQGDFYETCQAAKYNKDTEVTFNRGPAGRIFRKTAIPQWQPVGDPANGSSSSSDFIK